MIYIVGKDGKRRIPVKWGNTVIGYKVYRTGGLFNTMVFVGYEWK